MGPMSAKALTRLLPMGRVVIALNPPESLQPGEDTGQEMQAAHSRQHVLHNVSLGLQHTGAGTARGRCMRL
jgi:hypothetical protein